MARFLGDIHPRIHIQVQLIIPIPLDFIIHRH